MRCKRATYPTALCSWVTNACAENSLRLGLRAFYWAHSTPLRLPPYSRPASQQRTTGERHNTCFFYFYFFSQAARTVYKYCLPPISPLNPLVSLPHSFLSISHSLSERFLAISRLITMKTTLPLCFTFLSFGLLAVAQNNTSDATTTTCMDDCMPLRNEIFVKCNGYDMNGEEAPTQSNVECICGLSGLEPVAAPYETLALSSISLHH